VQGKNPLGLPRIFIYYRLDLKKELLMLCQKCGLEVTDDLLFCEDCGFTPSAPPIFMRRGGWEIKRKKTTYIIVLGRGTRFGGGDFNVVVNGSAYGRLKMGKTLTISVNEPDIEIMIKAMSLNPVKTKLRLGDENAYAEVAVWKKNLLIHSISGADII
jgi:hypothetical protein